MLITGIRKENLISYITINDEIDENDETRLISSSSFMDHLMNSLSSMIDNMESTSIVNLSLFWSHIIIQINAFNSNLSSSKTMQLQPKKFVRISFFHMQTKIISLTKKKKSTLISTNLQLRFC